MMKNMILTWQQAFESDVNRCGGKGWNLALLHHYGFQIPDGGVISSELYNKLISSPRIQSLTEQVAALPSAALIEGSDDLFNQINSAFADALLPAIFRSALQSYITQQGLANTFVSIRSSINQEDGEKASFAGIHDSILNVRGVEAIEAAILKCYASLWTPRAIAYRRKMEINDDEVTAAVIINKMVPSESAGVAFSCDPATGRRDLITINASYGLGESVVTGVVEPDQYHLYRFNKKIINRQIGQKRQLCRAQTTGGTEWVETEKPDAPCLNDTQLKQLARLCDRVFHSLGKGENHQDIEWAFDGSEFILLQARPVTALKRVACPEISDQPDIWSNGNFRDAIPMVVPHLVAEFCDQHINEILHSNFDGFYSVDPALRFARQFKGRFYCNVSLIQWLWFDSGGFPPEKTNLSMGGHQPLININEQYKKGLSKKICRLWRGIQFLRLLSTYRKKAPTIISDETAFADHYRKFDFTVLTEQQLIEQLQSLDKHLSDYNYSFIMLTSQSGALMMLILTLEKHLGERACALANTLMAGQADITSANHGYQLQRLAQQLKEDKSALQVVLSHDFQPRQWRTQLPEGSTFKQNFNAFIEQYGHRAVYEVDLSRPRWREEPAYLFDCIRGYLNTTATKNSAQNRQQANDEAWREIRRSVPRYLHGQIRNQLASAVAGAEFKEMSKSIYIRLMEPIRMVLLEMGRRLVKRGVLESVDDLFHCAQCEIEAVLQNEWDGEALKALVTERKATRLAQEQLPAPDVIFDDTPQQLTSPSFDKGSGLRGVGAALGVASGATRLIRTPDEGNRLKHGDVLVAPSTDPAWTPLFLNASAIVMETGGYLSHGSIVAREYGIPAVVNIAGVFNALNDGDQLRVDGNRGIVEVVK